MPRYAVYVLTKTALPLSRSLGEELGAPVHAPERFAQPGMNGFDSLRDLVAETFNSFDGHVFIAASGIVVRVIAPLLAAKDTDPAVVCMDPQGKHVVSLLSGHLGGANELARACARVTGGEAVITTATDSVGVPSMDMLARDKGVHIADLSEIGTVNAALLEGRTVQVWDPLGCLGELDSSLFHLLGSPDQFVEGEPRVRVHWTKHDPNFGLLRLYPPVLTVGVGCRRGTDVEEIHDLVLNVLEENGLARESVTAMASADIKRDETGLLQASRELGIPLEFFGAEELAPVATPTPSTMVEQYVGTASVSEAAALLLSRGGELLVPKQKTQRVTVAVARRNVC